MFRDSWTTEWKMSQKKWIKFLSLDTKISPFSEKIDFQYYLNLFHRLIIQFDYLIIHSIIARFDFNVKFFLLSSLEDKYV